MSLVLMGYSGKSVSSTAWETERNQQKVRVTWRFRTEDVRIKLERLYPSELMT